jgi:hypothetical protein
MAMDGKRRDSRLFWLQRDRLRRCWMTRWLPGLESNITHKFMIMRKNVNLPGLDYPQSYPHASRASESAARPC